MRSILALAAVLAVLVGGGVALASPSSTASKSPAAKPAAKTPLSTTATHHCQTSDGAGSTTSAGL
jgi:hypothetical protein